MLFEGERRGARAGIASRDRIERPTSLTLAGWWRLDDHDVPLVPALAHQEEAFEAFAARAKDPTRMRSLEFFFDDLPERGRRFEQSVITPPARRAQDVLRAALGRSSWRAD